MPLNTSLGRACSIAALVALSLTPLAAHGGREAQAPVVAAPAVAIDIDNFASVNPNYYRGAQPDARGYEALARLGVRTIVDLTSDEDVWSEARTRAEDAGMTYLRIPMSTRVPPTVEQVSRFLGTVTDAAAQPVYVHCVGGRHRTGVMTAVYRMTEDAWTPDAAFREMKRYKYGPDFLHPEFKKFVYGFPAFAARSRAQR